MPLSYQHAEKIAISKVKKNFKNLIFVSKPADRQYSGVIEKSIVVAIALIPLRLLAVFCGNDARIRLYRLKCIHDL